MKLSNNTVLITGGTAGIGFAIAKQLTENGNHVIITGRNKERLQKAVAQLNHVTGIVSDVSDEQQVDELVVRLQQDFPQLNVVINNAGRAFAYSLTEKGVDAYSKATEEFLTNYLAVTRLNEKLLPVLEQQPAAAIVNVTSITAFAPNSFISSYSASKAALHSYTQSLRVELAGKGNIKVFELMPPLVDTEFSAEIGGSKGIPPSAVATAFLDALQKDEYEIHVGGTADLYKLYLSSPAQALAAMNG
jgi:uncharacterized oxidoreductase